MNKAIIHGDVDLIPVNEIPKGLKKVATKIGNYVVRHGESGHKHVLTIEKTNAVDIYLDEKTGMHYFKVNEPTKISHEEHRTITITPGIYREDNETEYNPFEKILRQVKD